jgi:winged helix-turn-helix protein
VTVNTAPTATADTQLTLLTVDAVMGQTSPSWARRLVSCSPTSAFARASGRPWPGAGPLSIEEIAAASGVPIPIIREWVRSQSAAGYVHYDPDTDRYELRQEVAIALLAAPGGATVGACVEMLQSMMSNTTTLPTRSPRTGGSAGINAISTTGMEPTDSPKRSCQRT